VNKQYTIAPSTYNAEQYDVIDRALLGPCEDSMCERVRDHDGWHAASDPQRTGDLVIWPRFETWRFVQLAGVVSP
jgi:hypothetical protein